MSPRPAITTRDLDTFSGTHIPMGTRVRALESTTVPGQVQIFFSAYAVYADRGAVQFMDEIPQAPAPKNPGRQAYGARDARIRDLEQAGDRLAEAVDRWFSNDPTADPTEIGDAYSAWREAR